MCNDETRHYTPWGYDYPNPPQAVYVVFDRRTPDKPMLTTFDMHEAMELMLRRNQLPPENGTFRVGVYQLVKFPF